MDSASPPRQFWLSPFQVGSAHRLMLLLVSALVLGNGFFGEKVPANRGLGWDGVGYARMVRDLPQMVAAGDLGTYQAQRVLPAVVVRFLLALSGQSLTDSDIITAFVAYNGLLLILCCFIWKRIADIHHLHLKARWVGFLALFINFQASKYTLYYPVLTDVSALAAGMLLLLFHAQGRRPALVATTLAGAFCWPTVSVSGALLLLFPRTDGSSEASAGKVPQETPNRVLLGYLCPSGMAIAAYAGLRATRTYSCTFIGQAFDALARACATMGIEVPPHWLGPDGACIVVRQALTSLPSVLGLAIGLVVLLGLVRGGGLLLGAVRRIRRVDLALAAFALFAPTAIQRLIASESVQNPSSLAYLVRIIMLPTEAQFWMPLVGMAVYWGPLVLVVVLTWVRFSREARRMGLGIVLLIAVNLPFALVGEGRFLTAAWPFIVLVAVRALQSSGMRPGFLMAFALSSVAFAHFWLPLNIVPWTDSSHEQLLAFPKQMLFMHLGPWMNGTTYFIQLLMCAAAAYWLAVAAGFTRVASDPRPSRSG